MKLRSQLYLVVLGLIVGSLSAGFSAGQARAAGFPEKPIRWIIPFPPGGSNDILGRYLGVKLTDRLGQQVVIDNRAGANGIIGTEIASNAPADGYTLLMVSTSWVMNAAVRMFPLPYDIEKSFDPVATIGSAPNSLVVHPQGPFRTLRDLVAQAKSKPGSINYAHTGVGGFNHFGGELFKRVAGIDMLPVPYKGGGPAMVDVMAGNIPVLFTSVTQALPHVRNNRLKFLAIGAAKRNPAVPDVPTVAELGYPGYEVAVWWGVVTPAGVPRAALDKLRHALTAVLQDPDTKKRLLLEAAEPELLTGVDFRKKIHRERAQWTDLAKVAGMQMRR
ncbi:MAG: tripartite tricarboxylate transporter substrate binding protein [Betaproteobacteria bacterium]|nr:tripartite tricarboxylate transporter substrate binding protein [Betaproteobacteria bacterium]